MSRMLDDEYDDYNHHLLSIPSTSAIVDDENEPKILYDEYGEEVILENHDDESDKKKKPRTVRYSTVIFPQWHICYKVDPPILYREHTTFSKHCDFYNDHPEKCGNCSKDENPNVRFVKACPNGHLDEIDWKREVHKGADGCDGVNYFEWIVDGSSLFDIHIRCPSCGSNVTMNDIYSHTKSLPCSRRRPDLEDFKGNKVGIPDKHKKDRECDQIMSVIQKQSSSLRMSVTRTLLKIPTFDKSIVDSLISGKLKERLETLREFNIIPEKEDFLENIRLKVKYDKFKKIEQYLENHEVYELLELSEEVDTI